MATQGTTTVNFSGGALEATAAVIGQAGITSANLVEAWAAANETVGSQHDDSAWVERMNVYAFNIINGTGFTVIAKPDIGRAFGTYNINWVWN